MLEHYKQEIFTNSYINTTNVRFVSSTNSHSYFCYWPKLW